MVESFVITLREGIEAALVVCLTLAYLRKSGRKDLERPLWAGFTTALLLSVAGGAVVKATGFDPEGQTEGIVLAVSAVLVGWLVVWMWLHGKKLKQITEQKLGAILEKPSGGQKLGIFLFTFFMIFREGVETVLMLSAVNFTTDAILAFAGGIVGIAAAVAFGVSFFKGTIRVDLGRFFLVTTILLLVFVVQLVLMSLHEFAEAGKLRSSAGYMKVAGPLIRNSVLFVLAALALPFFLLKGPKAPKADPANPAEARKELAAARGQRVARAVFSALAIGAIALLGWTWAKERGELKMEPPTLLVAEEGEVAVPTADLDDKKLHRYGVAIDDKLVRFLAIRIDDRYLTVFDACEICRDQGYIQAGDRIVCRNCVADINIFSLGESGGCNPVPLPSEIRDGRVRVTLAELRKGKDLFQYLAFDAECPVCRMKFALQKAGGVVGGVPHCSMSECREELLRRK